MKHFVRFFWVLALLGRALPARADAASDQAAQTAFDEARRLSDAGNYSEACPKFEQSEQLAHGTGTLLNLADCYDKIGRTASAWKTFLRAADSARGQGREDRAKLALLRADVLQGRLSRLQLTIADPKPESLHVYVDAQELPRASWNAPLPLDPGRYTLRAERDSRVWSLPITLNEAGKILAVTIPNLDADPAAPPAPVAPAPGALAPAPGPPAAQLPPPGAAVSPLAPPAASALPAPDAASNSHTWAYVTGGVGLVALAVSGGFALAANSKYQTSLTHCRSDDKNVCSSQGLDERDSARSRGNIATGAAVVGLVGICVSALLLLSDSPPAHATAAVRALPSVSPHAASLELTYGF